MRNISSVFGLTCMTTMGRSDGGGVPCRIGPDRQRAQLNRRRQKLDPDSSPEEFRSSLQSDIDAVLAVDAGREELTHDTDPKSLVSEMKSWISDSLMPAAQFEIEGNPGPPLAGERRSE
jgi:hypothetical protein